MAYGRRAKRLHRFMSPCAMTGEHEVFRGVRVVRGQALDTTCHPACVTCHAARAHTVPPACDRRHAPACVSPGLLRVGREVGIEAVLGKGEGRSRKAWELAC